MKMLLFCVIAGILMATSIRGDMPGLNHLLKDFQFEIPEIDQGDLTIKSLICKDISFGNVGYVLSFFSSKTLKTTANNEHFTDSPKHPATSHWTYRV